MLLNLLANLFSHAFQCIAGSLKSDGEDGRDGHVQETIPLDTSELVFVKVIGTDDAVGVQIGGLLVEKIETF